MAWSGRAGDFFRGGDQLKNLQNDLFHAGYFEGANYAREVDGLFGGRTQSAVQRLQQDLTAAGVYSGPRNGVFDAATVQALGQLRSLTQLPAGIDAAAAQRLARFTSASQTPAAAQVTTRDTFEPARTAPVALNSPDAGEQRITAMTNYLATQVDMAALGRNGPITPQAYQAEVANVAQRLQAQPNTREILARVGKETLGFDPMNNSEAEVDGFLAGMREHLLASNAPAQTGPVSAEQRIENMVKLLGGGIDMAALQRSGPVTPERYQQAIGELAGRLEALPDTKGFFSKFSKEQLGFDPAKNSEADIDAFLRGIREQFAPNGVNPQRPTREGGPVDPVAVTQNMARVLSQYVDTGALAARGEMNPQGYQRELSRLAGVLMQQPNTRDLLIEVGRSQLGFDPAKSSESEVDAFLFAFQRQLLASPAR